MEAGKRIRGTTEDNYEQTSKNPSSSPNFRVKNDNENIEENKIESKTHTQYIASVNSNKNTLLPIIEFDIKGVRLKALCDSGASISMLSLNIYENLRQAEVKMKTLSRQVKIFTLDNTNIPFRQCVKINFKLNQTFVTGVFYVSHKNFQKEYDTILGYDFLKFNRMILDCDRKTLNFKNESIRLERWHNKEESIQPQINTVQSAEFPHDSIRHAIKDTENDRATKIDILMNEYENLETNNSQQENVNNSHENDSVSIEQSNEEYYARSKFTINLEPGQNKLITLKCPGNISTQQEILLEPIEHKLKIKYDWSVQQITSNRLIYIIVTNEEERKISIYKNMKIGKIITDFKISSDFILKENENSDKSVNQHNRNSEATILQVNNLDIQKVRKMREKELSEKDFKLDHLEKPIQQKFRNLLMNNVHAFSKSFLTLGQTSLVKPKFNLIHNFPIQTKPYKLPHTVRQFARKEIQKLLEANIIQPTESRYAFPVIFVKKNQMTLKRWPTEWHVISD